MKFSTTFVLVLTGIFEVSIGATVADNPTCHKFTKDMDIQNLIDTGHKKAQSCPCKEQIITIDYKFEKKKNCYKQWLFTEDVKQVCCYSDNGNLIQDGPGAGYLLVKSKEEYIEQAHNICCGNGSSAHGQTCKLFYQINPPDDCSSYIPPTLALSSGDPVIQTIDGEQYDFNGHGEYIFLTDNKQYVLQARTEYVVKGKIDSTYFSAFALMDITSKEQLELHYDKDKNDIRLYRNGNIYDNCSTTSHERPYPCIIPEQDGWFVIAGGGKIIVLHRYNFNSNLRQLMFGTDNFLSLQIIRNPRINTTNITGLAGHQENGCFIMRNFSRVPTNASESKLFEFAETWSLQNESESIFRYNETGGNYTFYNNHHTCPEFLEDKLGNLTALFKSFSQENITRFNQTCRNYWNKEPNDQCLLTIARTGNYSLGIAVMKEANATRRKWEILHNMAPKVSPDFPQVISVNYKSLWTINLTEFVTDDNTVPNELFFTVSTDLPTEEYFLDNNGLFKWNVGSGLRYIDTDIIFMVYDKFNASVTFGPLINYCGCIAAEFCINDTSNSNSSDTVKKAVCKCPEYAEGLYCEVFIDNCPKYHCYNDDCNATAYRSESSWPCAPCPTGRQHKMRGFNQTCYDIDECRNDKAGEEKCEQKCANSEGSFQCSCSGGYELNFDGYSCDDINECNQYQNLCSGVNEVCVNIAGNYTCICPTEYVRKGNSCTKSNSEEDGYANVKCTDSTWAIELDMKKLQTKYPDISPNDIFLGESNCKGKQEGSLLKFEYDLHQCKTTHTDAGITHIYNNKLFYVIFDPVIPFLIRRHIWTFTVECDVIRGGTGTSHLHHGIEMHHATYVNHFNVSVQLFSDQNLRNPIARDGGTINIGDDVYVKVTTNIADWNIKMRLHTCFTKPYVKASSNKDVSLISNGCEVDRNTHIISQSTHETSFVFRDFEYLTNDEGLDIFCNATFCDSRDFTPECSQSCYRGPQIIG